MSEKSPDDEIISDLLSPFQNALKQGGIDEEFLLKQVKKEFDATKRVTLKVDGAVDPKQLPEGWSVVATTGVIGYEDGKPYGTGETILEYRDDRMGIQQKARMDIHKLRGDYPATNVVLSPDEEFRSLVSEVMGEIDGKDRGKLPIEEEEE